MLSARRSGLKFHRRTTSKIRIATARKFIDAIKHVIPSAIPAGSFRRGLSLVNDIDIIVDIPIHTVSKMLENAGILVVILASGKHKMAGIVKVGNMYRRIDIVHATAKELPFALLYLTGDKIQNIRMRQKAKKMGYRLNEHGLFNRETGRAVKGLETESAIFNFLELPWRAPCERSH